jgi:hypothetical protein
MRPMKRRNSQGQTFIEFLFVMLWAVPFLLITIALGINLIEGLEVIQLARDTASMYARKVDFTTSASKLMLDRIGNSLNLKTGDSTNSQAVIVMSALTFMDTNACATAVAGGCTCSNSGKWVFAQYQILPAGSTIAAQSKYGNPGSSSGLIDSTGQIQLCNPANHALSYATSGAALAAGFEARGITSWGDGSAGYGLPSGQVVYLVEVTANGYAVPGLVDPAPGHTSSLIYNYAIF